MKSEMDLLAEVRPATPASADVVPPDERALLLHRIVTTPDPAPSRRPAARTAPRRIAVLRLAAPAAAVGAPAVLAVTVVAPHGSSEAPAGAGPRSSAGGTVLPDPGDAQSVRYVVARAETALAATGDMVLVSTTRDFRGCDSRTVALLDAAGRPARDRWTETCGGKPSQDVSEELVAARPHSLLVITVHHWDRTWSRGYVAAGDDPHDGFSQVSSPELLRAELARGELVIVGRESVDGRATIHLRAPSRDWPSSLDPQYWIDASSYLLVRSRIVKGSAEEQVPLVTEHEWLRQTAAAGAADGARPPGLPAHHRLTAVPGGCGGPIVTAPLGPAGLDPASVRPARPGHRADRRPAELTGGADRRS